ncbi:hypothetical protein [Lysinibacillus fusiformis]
MFYVRKRSGGDRMLVTQAFSQDVKVLACVPLFIVGMKKTLTDRDLLYSIALSEIFNQRVTINEKPA